MALRHQRKTLFEIGVAGTQKSKLGAACRQHRQDGEEQVEALLRGQAADHPEQRYIRSRFEPEAALQRRFGRLLSRRRIFEIAGLRQVGIILWIPNPVIDAIQDPAQHRRAAAQQPVEAPAERRGLDLRVHRSG